MSPAQLWMRKGDTRDSIDRKFALAESTAQRHENLRQTLAELSKLTEGDTTDVPHLRSQIALATANSDELDLSLRSFLPAILFSRVVSPQANRVREKVFGIPELLELVLSQLPLVSLSNARLVSQSWKAAIDSSPRLQRVLCYTPESPSGHFRQPFGDWMEETEGLGFEARAKLYVTMDPKEGFRFEACFGLGANRPNRDSTPISIGSSIRKMLLCQQPVLHTIGLYTDCCFEKFDGAYDHPERIISSKTGLTIGDLFDAHCAVHREHQHCSSTNVTYKPDSGERNVEIDFITDIKIPLEDPLVAEALVKREQYKLERMQRIDLDAKGLAYNGQKREAEEQGETFYTFKEWLTFPTYKEWMAMNDIEDASSEQDL